MKGRHPLFRSTNPNLIQVDSSGRATATGFGFGDILVAVEGIPGVARTQVCAGTLRLEPPYVRLVAGAQGTVQLKVIGERLYGSRLA